MVCLWLRATLPQGNVVVAPLMYHNKLQLQQLLRPGVEDGVGEEELEEEEEEEEEALLCLLHYLNQPNVPRQLLVEVEEGDGEGEDDHV
jgi:hypothetical protein